VLTDLGIQLVAELHLRDSDHRPRAK